MQNDQFYKELLDSLSDGVYFVDLKGRVTYWNKTAERLTGYAAQEIVGKACADNFLKHVDEVGVELCTSHCPLKGVMMDGDPRECNVFMHHKLGHRVPVYVRATPMRDDAGSIIGAVELFTDSSRDLDARAEVEKLRKEILTDELTSVGNRRYAIITQSRLETALFEDKVPYGVLMADIDHFKQVNDTFGHPAGDAVLVMVAQTLKSTLRPLDVICRWGGEEFIVLVPNITEDALGEMGERLRGLLTTTWIDRPEGRINVTVSLGGAVAERSESAESVIERADRQLYLSKKHGRNCVHVDQRCVDPKKG